MPMLIQYLIKLSVALSVIWLFYALILRRLTFYNWNRWYLLIYPVLAFVIPLFDITGILEEHKLSGNMVVQVIPALGMGNTQYIVPAVETGKITRDPWQVLLIVLLVVMVLMSMRLLMRYFSYLLMRRSAQVIANAPVKVFQVNMNIVPFSFGSSIYINQAMHSEEELKKIIEHEFVHIRQRHSLDIILAEILCILNWYNPFAWLIRRSMRQNLEFIADHDVLKTGIDPKQYQYLLLKVTGNTAYGMGNNFNLSSLAKRIIMMNKAKSAGIHVLKFLFILPLVAVMILAFRNSHHDHPSAAKIPVVHELQKNMPDTVPARSKAGNVHVTKTTRGSLKNKPDSFSYELRTDSYELRTDSLVIDASLKGPGNPYLFSVPALRGRLDSLGPLVLVNGREFTQSLNSLDVNQIESISIFKGKEAEPYGLKGKNGVILITMKEPPELTITWQKIIIGSGKTNNGKPIEVKQEFIDSVNKLREDKSLLFIGIFNVVEIKVKNVAPENIVVQVDNATVTRENGKFSIITKTPGKTMLKITITGSDGTTKEFIQKDLDAVYLPSPAEKDIVNR